MVVFDATMISLLLRPGSPAPLDPATGERVKYAEHRVAELVKQLERARAVVIVPTPVLSEVLIKAGPAGPAILKALQQSSAFRLVGFDARAAVELAQMTNDLASNADKRAGIEAPWTKIKFDRQIVAITRVNRATAIYTDDLTLAAFATLHDIPCVKVADLPVPASAMQPELEFPPEPDDEPKDT